MAFFEPSTAKQLGSPSHLFSFSLIWHNYVVHLSCSAYHWTLTFRCLHTGVEHTQRRCCVSQNSFPCKASKCTSDTALWSDLFTIELNAYLRDKWYAVLLWTACRPQDIGQTSNSHILCNYRCTEVIIVVKFCKVCQSVGEALHMWRQVPHFLFWDEGS